MRPYLAIIKDSFREAIHSRVLWILLVLITLVLLIMAPLGYRLKATTTFAWADVPDAQKLAVRMHEAGTALAPSRGKRVWEMWDQLTRDAVTQFARAKEGPDREFFRRKQELVSSLNDLLTRRDLFDATVWTPASLSKEARDLIDKSPSKLSKGELARLNRILIESAFPGQFNFRSASSVQLTYLGFVFVEQLPLGKERVESIIKDWLLPTMMQFIVGIVGIIAGVLVTSPIIPQMFEPGSITLLLSKPISRTLLFLSKFIGGCAFILLCSSYLILGMWLIVGLQTSIWNQGMLWCIPVFMFLFLIYYSISALAGLIWKSPVVAVVVTVVFWGTCLLADGFHWIFAEMLTTQFRFVRLVEAGETRLAIREMGAVVRWDASEKTWQQVAGEPNRGGFPKTIGPYYHEKTRQVVTGHGWQPPFGMGRPTLALQLASEDQGWQIKPGPTLPSGTATFFFDPKQSLLAVSSDGVFRLSGDPAPPRADVKVLGFSIPLGMEPFHRVSDDKLRFEEPLEAAIHPKHGRIAIYSRGTVQLLTVDDKGKYHGGPALELEGDESQGTAIAYAGDTVVVARADGNLWLIDGVKCTVRKKLTPEPDSQPRVLTADAQGRWFAVLYQNDYLWLLDARDATIRQAPVRGQGEISAVAFGKKGLLVADRIHRVTQYDLESFSRLDTTAPALTAIEIFYYYFVSPVYTVFPKPRLLDQTVNYLLSGKETQDWGLATGNLELKRDNLRPWKPVKSSLAFVFVVLVIACLYIERHEF